MTSFRARLLEDYLKDHCLNDVVSTDVNNPDALRLLATRRRRIGGARERRNPWGRESSQAEREREGEGSGSLKLNFFVLVDCFTFVCSNLRSLKNFYSCEPVII